MEELHYISGELHDSTELLDAGLIIMKAAEFGNHEIFHAIVLPFECVVGSPRRVCRQCSGPVQML